MISDLLELITKVVPNANKAKELEAKIAEAHSKALTSAVEADAKIQLEEAKSDGLRAIWRPLSAIMTYSIIFLYWFIYPVLQLVIACADLDIYLPQLESLPIEFYGLATAFISIYAYGRSLEKRIK